MTPQTQSNLSNDGTFMFQKTQNKSLCGGGTIGSMGTIMSSFGLQSVKSTWVKPSEGKNKLSPNRNSQGNSKHVGKKLKVDYLKHLKLESKNIKHHMKRA
jgi:hypothetical protein